jgi:hypothetical protein
MPLHNFSQTYIDKQLKEEFVGYHENELLFNCELHSVRGLTLKNCDLNRTRLLVEDMQKALDFTVTLDCKSFNNVELSPLLFDLLLILLLKTKGNTDKRNKIITLLGKERISELLKQMEGLE